MMEGLRTKLVSAKTRVVVYYKSGYRNRFLSIQYGALEQPAVRPYLIKRYSSVL